MPATNNKRYRNTAGTLVAEYLSSRINGSEPPIRLTPEFVMNLKKGLTAIINKVISIMGISKMVTDMQIEDTISQLIIEIITEPKAYTALTESDITKDSIHVSSKLREIVSIEKEPASLIHSYITKRAFSLLKYFAEEDCKAYLRINERIKKALKDLKQQNRVFETAPNHYSASTSPTAVYIKGSTHINSSEELKQELQKAKPNTKRFILAFLRANSCLNFQTRDISSYFISEQQIITDKKIKSSCKKEDEASEEIIGKESSTNSNFEAKQIAIDTMKLLIHSVCQDSITKAKSEMACLALLCRTAPANFKADILTEDQLQASETNCIEMFLNDKRFVAFNKSKQVGRTTAYNFLKKGQSALKTILRDLEADIQIEFIKSYSQYLETRFEELTRI